MESILNILLDRDEIEKTSTRGKLDEKINVAGGTRLPPCNGTENPHIGRTMTGGHARDRFPIMVT
jgi:hypothetical protein